MEITCLIFIIFVSVIYFSIGRVKTYVHRLYSGLLITTTGNIIFDMITIYTVNHLDKVPEWLNHLCHQIFIGSLDVALFLISLYVVNLVRADWLDTTRNKILWCTPIAVALIVIAFGDLYYMKTEAGNYSYGPAARTCYTICAVYLILSVYVIIQHWHETDRRKKNVVLAALTVEILVSVYQGLHPTALISSLGLTLIVLSVFLTMENPGRFLVEQYLQEKERADAANRAKSVFLANMSHEIRTPINAVLGMDEMILREYHDPQLLDYANNIKKAGKNLLSLVNDILDLSKIESGKMEIVPVSYDLSDVLNDLTSMISFHAHTKGISLKVRVNADMPHHLQGDDVRIRQILTNLLTNAVKYTDQGTITLEVDFKQEDSTVIFRVKDTGIGIREQDMERLFDSFQRLDQQRNHNIEGTGLGMNITMELVNRMDGRIQVESRYGEGSTFIVQIPQTVLDAEPIGDFHKRFEKIMDAKGQYRESFVAPDARILVVDDNVMNLKVVVGLLKQTKVQVDTAASGRECLEKVKEQPYDIIFLDHMMPDMDGIETLEKLNEFPDEDWTRVPVIALTANAVTGAKEMYLQKGFTDFLAKPITVLTLEDMVRQYLPDELIEKTETEKMKEEPVNNLPELDRKTAIDGLGSEELYEELLSDYGKELPERMDQIRTFEQTEDIKNYTIAVHGLKSTSRMVGAMALAMLAEKLEGYGHKENIDAIHEETGQLIEKMEEIVRRIEKA